MNKTWAIALLKFWQSYSLVFFLIINFAEELSVEK